MNLLSAGIYTSLQLFLIIAIGFAGRKLKIIRDGFAQTLGSFLVRIALPVYFFARFSMTDMRQLREGLWLLPIALILLIAGLLIGWILFAALPFSKKEKRAGIALSAFGNSGYMPLTIIEIIPLSIPLLAETVDLNLAAVFVGAYLVVNSPILWSLGNTLVARREADFRLMHLFSPPTFGILAGLLVPLFGLQGLFSDQALPFFYLHAALERLGSVILPLILVNLGVMIAGIRLQQGQTRHLGLMAGAVLLSRFVFFPLLFFIARHYVFPFFNLAPAFILVLFLQTHTPSATNLSAMAAEGGVNEDLTAFTLLISYVLYVLVLPLYLFLFLGGAGL